MYPFMGTPNKFFCFSLFLFVFVEEQVMKRGREKAKRLESLQEMAEREIKKMKKSETISLKWSEENWCLVDPSKYVFKRCFEQKVAKPELSIFPDGQRTSKWEVFKQMWPILTHIPTRKAESEGNIWSSSLSSLNFLSFCDSHCQF